MRWMFSAVALLSTACGSGASQDPHDAATDHAAEDASSGVDAANDAVVEADAVVSPSEGACAACTANDCIAQLQACGEAQDCVDDLVTFNNCLSTSGSHCGTTFAAGGSGQTTLWACLMTQCPTVCGTN